MYSTQFCRKVLVLIVKSASKLRVNVSCVMLILKTAQKWLKFFLFFVKVFTFSCFCMWRHRISMYMWDLNELLLLWNKPQQLLNVVDVLQTQFIVKQDFLCFKDQEMPDRGAIVTLVWYTFMLRHTEDYILSAVLLWRSGPSCCRHPLILPTCSIIHATGSFPFL